MESLLSCKQVGVSAEIEQWRRQNPSLPVPLSPLRRWLSLGLGLEKNLAWRKLWGSFGGACFTSPPSGKALCASIPGSI